MLNGTGTVLTHLPRAAVYAHTVWEIRQRQADILLLCGKKVIFDRQDYTESWQQAPSRYACYWGNFARVLSWGLTRTQHGCTPLHHQGSSSCRVFIRVRFITPNGTSGRGTGVKMCSQAVWGAMAWHGGTAASQPHVPPQPLAVPPSIHLLIPPVLSSRAPWASLPNTHPDAGRCQVVSAAP